jgi:hypothetical protein
MRVEYRTYRIDCLRAYFQLHNVYLRDTRDLNSTSHTPVYALRRLGSARLVGVTSIFPSTEQSHTRHALHAEKVDG